MYQLMAKRLPGYYFDGEKEGYAILLEGKKIGVVDRWTEYNARGAGDREWNARISAGKMTIGTERGYEDIKRMLELVRAKVEQLPRQVVIDFLRVTPDYDETELT